MSINTIIEVLLEKTTDLKRRLHIVKKMLCAKRIIRSVEDTTPILYDSYNSSDYYIIVNNNRNNIYTISELHTLISKKVEDPFTRMKITKYSFVKIKLC
jgi:hypothetical protein